MVQKTAVVTITTTQGILPSWIGIGTTVDSSDPTFLRVSAMLMQSPPDLYIYLNGRTVRLLKNGVQYASGVTDGLGSGWFEWNLSPLAEGTYTFQTVFDGDAEYAPSQSEVITHTVSPPPPGKAVLNGKVVWQELRVTIPVPNVTVSLNGNLASTDNAGNFSFTVDLGTYTLTISHLLFDQYTEQLNLVTEKTYNLTALLKLKMIVKAGAGVVAAGAITIPMILAFRKPAPTYLAAPSGKYER